MKRPLSVDELAILVRMTPDELVRLKQRLDDDRGVRKLRSTLTPRPEESDFQYARKHPLEMKRG